jgi:carboxylesterase
VIDGELGALVIHGFTGTPFEVRYLADQLANARISAAAPPLAGHCTTVDDLERTTWHDWVGGIERELDLLAGRVKRVALVGQSLGGLLALYVASRRRDVAAVASLAAPLWLDGIAARVAQWTAPGGWLAGIRRLPKFGSDVRDRSVSRANPGYGAIPTRALAELCTFMRVVDDALPSVTQPVLVIHAEQDHTAPVACASRIAARTNARLEILPRSFHLIAADVERDRVATSVIHFLEGVPCAT